MKNKKTRHISRNQYT